jgi:hypothetical protein
MPDDQLYRISAGAQQFGTLGSAGPLDVPVNTREEALDVYKDVEASSGSNVLPLILAAYPSNGANSLLLVTSPGAGAQVNIKDTTTLEVTLPGGDILVEFSADIDWVLPSAVYTQSSSTIAAATPTSSAEATHKHSVTGQTSSAASGDYQAGMASENHTHIVFSYGGAAASTAFPVEFKTYAGTKKWGMFALGDTGDFESSSVFSDPNAATLSYITHTHTIATKTSAAGESHSHTVTVAAHSHTIGPTSALLDVKAELVVDGIRITAGLSQFHIEGFTGKAGVIQLRSVYILQKTTVDADALSAGQHSVGLTFTVSTTDFSAVSTVTAKNIALILRDAGFDPAVKIFVP